MALVYRLEKLNFNGPLDLLLKLLEKNKVDIYDIPIAEITAQYMEYVRNLEGEDLDIVSDFLVMAATLLSIKARMLLPREVDQETGEEIDPRTELVERLLEYKEFRYISGELCKLEDQAAGYLYGKERIPAEVQDYKAPVDLEELLQGVSLQDLKRVFLEVLARKEEKVDRVRSDFGVIKRERISLSARIGSVLNYTRKHRNFSFRQMLGQAEGRMEVVVTFLALLELMKMGKVQVCQKDTFSDIEVHATKETDTEDLDLRDLEDV